MFWDNCPEINRLLDGKAWIMGSPYTVCDPYALFFEDLGTRIKLPMHELATYAAFLEANTGTPRSAQGTRIGGRYSERFECMAWTIITPSPGTHSNGLRQRSIRELSGL